MIRLDAPASPPPATGTGLAVDHIGVVVHDLALEVARWRGAGFFVSDPVPLMGTDSTGKPVPLGQSSAHVVFENSYVELSSPDPHSANHLLPYLKQGEGVRILVLASADAEAAQAQLAARWPATAAVMSSSRRIVIGGEAHVARFRWFPMPFDLIVGVLSAVVEHQTPDLVFHPSLRLHPNGAQSVTRVRARGRRAMLSRMAGLAAAPQAPELAVEETESALGICGIEIATAKREQRFYSLTSS